MASAHEVEMVRRRRRLDDLTARMEEVRQQSSSTAMIATVIELRKILKTMEQSALGSQNRTHLSKTFATGTSRSTHVRVHSILPLNTAKQPPTVVVATPLHEQHSATLWYLLTQEGALKVLRKTGNDGFGAYRQLCLMYGTSDQEGNTGLSVKITTHKFGCKKETWKTVRTYFWNRREDT